MLHSSPVVKLTVVGLFVTGFSVNFGAAQEPPASADNEAKQFHLIWSDEFDYQGRPDPEKWGFEQGFVRNEELQWYQPENASVNDGMLVIEAREESVKNPRYDTDARGWQRNREFAQYTSASLRTRGLGAWLYGRFEMRARIPTSPGMWPAFWTLGVDRGWPACGEIDIMEYYRGVLLANVAWGADWRNVVWRDSRTPIRELGGEDWSDEFHTWRLDWDAEQIRLYVDDRLLREVTVEEANEESGFNPLRQPHYILINLAIGGANGGDPSGSEFPAKYEIDYVRVYQRPDAEE